mmetsp:Transcript_25347/g.51570  ORF Transcript_25347/g.51570 Transcript_25347/m.51570 type:complete len:256 (+) Transcript_25347:491-1258(+)
MDWNVVGFERVWPFADDAIQPPFDSMASERARDAFDHVGLHGALALDLDARLSRRQVQPQPRQHPPRQRRVQRLEGVGGEVDEGGEGGAGDGVGGHAARRVHRVPEDRVPGAIGADNPASNLARAEPDLQSCELAVGPQHASARLEHIQGCSETQVRRLPPSSSSSAHRSLQGLLDAAHNLLVRVSMRRRGGPCTPESPDGAFGVREASILGGLRFVSPGLGGRIRIRGHRGGSGLTQRSRTVVVLCGLRGLQTF